MAGGTDGLFARGFNTDGTEGLFARGFGVAAGGGGGGGSVDTGEARKRRRRGWGFGFASICLLLFAGCVPNPFGPHKLSCEDVTTIFVGWEGEQMVSSVGTTEVCDEGYYEFCTVYIAQQSTMQGIAAAASEAITKEQMERCDPPFIAEG